MYVIPRKPRHFFLGNYDFFLDFTRPLPFSPSVLLFANLKVGSAASAAAEFDPGDRIYAHSRALFPCPPVRRPPTWSLSRGGMSRAQHHKSSGLAH